MDLKVPCHHCGRTNWPPATASGEVRPCIFCGLPIRVYEAPPPPPPPPEHVLHLPPLPPLAWEDGHWVALVEIPGFPAPEPVELTVEVEDVEYDLAVTDPTVSLRPSAEQVAAWVGIVANGPAIRVAVLACLLRALDERFTEGEVREEWEESATILAETDLRGVHLSRTHRDGVSYAWWTLYMSDYEHGFGVAVHGVRAVVALGHDQVPSEAELLAMEEAEATRLLDAPLP